MARFRHPLPAGALTLALLTAVVAGCGTTEKSGDVGDELSADGLEVTVEKVDTSVPVPEHDVTGLSTPLPGKKLVGVRARVCSNHAGATGPFDFAVESSDGRGRLKYPANNYDDAFESFRDTCADGWVVFEIPASATLEHVTYGFEDTGSARRPQNQVKARFSWDAPS